MIASRTPPVSGKTGRPELLLICGSLLSVIAILAIVTFLLIREHANARQSATRSATTIAQLIDADVLRTVELYDLTLQGLIASAQRDDLQTSRRRSVIWRCSTAPPRRASRATSCCSTSMAT